MSDRRYDYLFQPVGGAPPAPTCKPKSDLVAQLFEDLLADPSAAVAFKDIVDNAPARQHAAWEHRKQIEAAKSINRRRREISQLTTPSVAGEGIRAELEEEIAYRKKIADAEQRNLDRFNAVDSRGKKQHADRRLQLAAEQKLADLNERREANHAKAAVLEEEIRIIEVHGWDDLDEAVVVRKIAEFREKEAAEENRPTPSATPPEPPPEAAE